jgi:hypothetical protein
MPASQVSAPLLAEVQKKVEAGVPLLIIGKIPASEGPDWFKWLGVDAQADPPADPDTQQVDPTWQNAIATRGMDQTFKMPMPASFYSAKAGGLQPVVQRAGRLVVGIVDEPKKRIVFHGMLYPLFTQDDPAVRQVAVEAFNRMLKRVVVFDDQTGGYAFQGLDGALYAVVENRESRPTQAHLKVTSPVGTAANLLTGERFSVSAKADGNEIVVPLQADGAGVVVIRP